jgi:hypothetical protein
MPLFRGDPRAWNEANSRRRVVHLSQGGVDLRWRPTKAHLCAGRAIRVRWLGDLCPELLSNGGVL